MDTDKLDMAEKAIKFARENAIVLGFLGTAVPAVFGLGYTAITEINKAKDSLESFRTIVDEFPSVKRKAEGLEEKVKIQQETINDLLKNQTSAVLNAERAKNVSDATKIELNSKMESQSIIVEQKLNGFRDEIKAMKKSSVSSQLGK